VHSQPEQPETRTPQNICTRATAAHVTAGPSSTTLIGLHAVVEAPLPNLQRAAHMKSYASTATVDMPLHSSRIIRMRVLSMSGPTPTQLSS
jgi:hypothetical protein